MRPPWKILAVVVFTTLSALSDTQAQVVTPNPTDLVQVISPLRVNPAFTYSTVANLGGITAPIRVPIRTVTASGNITISSATDYFVCVNLTTPAAIAINLPAAPATGLTFLVKDCSGTAAANNLTITPAAGNIDGSATYVMNANYSSVAVTYNGTAWFTN